MEGGTGGGGGGGPFLLGGGLKEEGGSGGRGFALPGGAFRVGSPVGGLPGGGGTSPLMLLDVSNLEAPPVDPDSAV